MELPVAPLSIGEAARSVGVSVATLRLWEDQGLIRPRRSAGGLRRYDEHDIALLRRIVHLRRREGLNPRSIARVLAEERRAAPEPACGAADNGPQPGWEDVAQELRRRRRDLGLTLREVSERTGVSVSHLSAIERGQQRPSFATLLTLTQRYGIMIQDLISNRERSGRVVRSGDRPHVPSVDRGVLIEQLALGRTHMEPQLFTLPPGAESGGFYRHRGEEFVFVLSGRMTFWLGDNERHDLAEGDSLYFPSSLPHRWGNPGPEAARALWVSATQEEGG